MGLLVSLRSPRILFLDVLQHLSQGVLHNILCLHGAVLFRRSPIELWDISDLVDVTVRAREHYHVVAQTSSAIPYLSGPGSIR